MREVKKKWYVIKEEFNLDGDIKQQDVEYCVDSREEAINKAKNLWYHLTKKEQERNSIHVCMWHSVQDDNGQWHSVMEDDEEFTDDMQYLGAYNLAYEISSYGESDLFTFDD